MSTKEPASRKDHRQTIKIQLSQQFAYLKEDLGEKSFKKSIKKASKALASKLSKTTIKKGFNGKAVPLGKRVKKVLAPDQTVTI